MGISAEQLVQHHQAMLPHVFTFGPKLNETRPQGSWPAGAPLPAAGVYDTSEGLRAHQQLDSLADGLDTTASQVKSQGQKIFKQPDIVFSSICRS